MEAPRRDRLALGNEIRQCMFCASIQQEHTVGQLSPTAVA
jgi:hypothetical protein